MFKSIGFICLLALFTLSYELHARDSRYGNIYHVTHISGGWVATSNGDLYHCAMNAGEKEVRPECVLAIGLPSHMQTVSVLWGEGEKAWVAYTDGHVYGCRYRSSASDSGPTCVLAAGLP